MSILINLLPDIRQAKLRERRRRQLVSGVSILVWIVCGGIVVVLSAYTAGQKVIINNYSNAIDENKAKLERVTGLVDALTAQQHLSSLTALYDQRVYISKFFSVYAESNPVDVTLTSMAIDSQNVLLVNGSGTTYAAVAKLARALEASHVKVGTGAAETNQPYFTNVVISNISAASKGVGFTLSATLDPGVTNGAN